MIHSSHPCFFLTFLSLCCIPVSVYVSHSRLPRVLASWIFNGLGGKSPDTLGFRHTGSDYPPPPVEPTPPHFSPSFHSYFLCPPPPPQVFYYPSRSCVPVFSVPQARRLGQFHLSKQLWQRPGCVCSYVHECATGKYWVCLSIFCTFTDSLSRRWPHPLHPRTLALVVSHIHAKAELG